MKERVLTGSIIFLAIIFAILARVFSVYVFDAFVVVLMVLSSLEVSKVFANMGYYNHKKLILGFGPILYALYFVLIMFKLPLMWSVLSVLGLLIVMMTISFLMSLFAKNKTDNEIKTRSLKLTKTKFAINKAVHTLFGFVYPTLALSFFVLLNHFSSIVEISTKVENSHLIGLVGLVFMFVITTTTDVFAMFVGKAFGKRNFAKNISPNKTIEGSVGGFVFAILISVCVFLLFGAFETFSSLFYNIGFDIWKVLILSGLGSVVSMAGDLFESYLKRKANLKDSGTFLPGHGGFLDRFDSHIFNIVWVFLFFLVIL